MSGKKNMKGDESDPDVSSDSDSDFEDPDTIEVPGNYLNIFLKYFFSKF